MSLADRVRAGFFRYGWLLPLTVVAGHALGRAVASVSLGVYLLWALSALRRRDLKLLPRPLMLLYAAMLTAFALGIPGALAPDIATVGWLKLLGMSLALPITWIALRRADDWKAALERWAAIAAAAVALRFVGGILLAAITLGWEGVDKGHNGMIAATLFPLALALPLAPRRCFSSPWCSRIAAPRC